MNIKCIIVDDEPIARQVLKEYIEDVLFLELIGQAENPLKAQAILNSEEADLMFLDINMPKLTGIEFLKTSSHLPVTIFTTAYSEYALEGFELDVLDYLLKPISFERFLRACNKAKDFFELKTINHTISESKADFFFIKCDGKIEKIFYNDLVYVEAMMNYVVLHTIQKKMIVYLTIKSIIQQLPSSVFLKVHKSFIINTSKISSIEGNEINLGNSKVVISQNSYEEVMKVILQNRMIKR